MPVPPEIPIVDPSSPQFDDLMLVDSINTTIGRYKRMPRGTRHPDAKNYPGYQLVLEKPFPGDEKWIQRYWTADPVCEDTYNLAQQTFDEEDATKEVFTRHYLVRRTEYIAANIPAKLSALTGVIGVRVTAGGSGYDETTTVSFAGGAGSGAAASPIIFRGAVVGIYLTAEGTGYTSAPTVTITHATGVGAAATARIQPTTAKLVKEQADRMEGQPEDGLYLKITRIYHTLPGAVVASYTSGVGGKLKRTRRQKVELPAFPTDSSTNLITQKIDAIPDLGTVVGLKVTEDWTNSDGTTTGTPVPWVTKLETLEPEGVKLAIRVKVAAPATEAPPMGRDYLETAGDMAGGATYGGRRRIPTFPTGITNAGEWEDAQAYVVHSERRDIEDSPNKLIIVHTCPRPRNRYEFPELTFQFPALFTFNTVTSPTSLTLVNGRLALRMDGNVNYTSHRTRRVAACLLRKYTIRPNTPALSNQFYLNSPGAGSAFFGQIDANTIYADLGAGKTYVSLSNDSGEIERFPFSTVTGCAQAANSVAGTDLTPADGTLPALYRLKAEEMVWRGAIYVREYLCVGEDRNLITDANNSRFAPTAEGTDTGGDTATTTQWLYCA